MSDSIRADLTDRVVLLTGATGGLGRRAAQVLSDAGATVAAVARDSDALRAVEREVPRTVAFPADLADADAIKPLVDRIGHELGLIDVLINNAARVSDDGRGHIEPLGSIRDNVDINLIAPMLLAQGVFPAMKQRGRGVIINVSSIVAQVGMGRFQQTSYAATKGALTALTRAWAVQWAQFGIRSNAIAPGFIATSMNSAVIDDPSTARWVEDNAPLGRAGRPSDLDGALLFLASDQSEYVTGQTVVVDGGWTAR
jgi:NAD(P)-dependent dehydrogenase (short-subunit alcohol dehydrogenase family)